MTISDNQTDMGLLAFIPELHPFGLHVLTMPEACILEEHSLLVVTITLEFLYKYVHYSRKQMKVVMNNNCEL
jgi:hypothetical protein